MFRCVCTNHLGSWNGKFGSGYGLRLRELLDSAQATAAYQAWQFSRNLAMSTDGLVAKGGLPPTDSRMRCCVTPLDFEAVHDQAAALDSDNYCRKDVEEQIDRWWTESGHYRSYKQKPVPSAQVQVQPCSMNNDFRASNCALVGECPPTFVRSLTLFVLTL